MPPQKPPPAPPPPPSPAFAAAVTRWQKKHGRRHLPWQNSADPYRVWLAEIMLQQTQVAAVIPYYKKFLRAFPDIGALARARLDRVLALWSGLGYYARARHLHRAAQIMHKTGAPQTAAEWRALPGVGRSTAAAIMVFTRGGRCAILDGNVKRVLARAFAVAQPPAEAEAALWTLAESLLPGERDMRAYTQGLMDLGAMVCLRAAPRCAVCPLRRRCAAHRQGATGDYPVKGRAAAKTVLRVHMLLAQSADGRVLLQKRPAAGIWGGMWSLPEAANKAALRAQWREILDAPAPAATRQIRHELTHRRMHIAVHIRRGARAAPAAAAKWVSKRELPRFALPAPLRRLLSGEGL